MWLTAKEIEDLQPAVKPPLPDLDFEEKQYQYTGQVVDDDQSPYCGEPVLTCIPDGGCYVYVGDPKIIVEIDLSGDTELNVPGADTAKRFEGEVRNLIVEHATTTVATLADVIAVAVAAGLPDMTCKGSALTVPATADDVCAYKVHRIPCSGSYLTDPTDVTSAVTVALDADDALYVGGLSINSTADDAFAGVDPATPIAPGVDAVSVWCLQYHRDLTKAELAAL